MKKKILVVWSGGMDSTSVLCDALADGYDVETMYTILENNEGKYDNELRRRKMMMCRLRLEHGFDFKDTIVTIPSLRPPKDSIITFWQPTLWVWGLMMFFTKQHEFEEIRFGYIKKDDFWHVRDRIVNFYKAAFGGLMSHDYFRDEKKFKLPELVYPFEWTEKYELAEYMHKHHRSIFHLLWTCENPSQRGRECNECNTCRKKIEMYDKLYTKEQNEPIQNGT